MVAPAVTRDKQQLSKADLKALKFAVSRFPLSVVQIAEIGVCHPFCSLGWQEKTVTTEPDLTSVLLLEDYIRANPEEATDIREFARQASEFVGAHAWCRSVDDIYVSRVFPGIVGLFLLRVTPARRDADDWTWAVVGDLPPAYLASESCVTPRDALEGYVGEMQAWVDAAKSGEPVDDLIPVSAPPTTENAINLQTRLDFLEQRILPQLQPL